MYASAGLNIRYLVIINLRKKKERKAKTCYTYFISGGNFYANSWGINVGRNALAASLYAFSTDIYTRIYGILKLRVFAREIFRILHARHIHSRIN